MLYYENRISLLRNETGSLSPFLSQNREARVGGGGCFLNNRTANTEIQNEGRDSAPLKLRMTYCRVTR